VRLLSDIAAVRTAVSEVEESTFFERALPGARLVTVPVVGDGEGGAVSLPELEDTLIADDRVLMRECPSSGVSPELRERLQNLAGDLAHHLQYSGVLSVTFSIGIDGIPWFHSLFPGLPPSWWLVDSVGGVDLVGAQLVLAVGEGLGWSQEEVKVQNHALHLILLAEEDGILESLKIPEGADSLLLRAEGAELKAGSPIACFRIQASTRHAALVKAQVLLQHIEVEGLSTSLPFLRQQLTERRVWEGFPA
jgi:acetyl/propionyl-CoA carboxylase alpha subunit